MNEKTMEEMKKLAVIVAERPYLADVVGSEVYKVSKYGSRRLSEHEKQALDLLDEKTEDVIPMEVLLFLKKKKNIPKFIDMIRVEIWKKMVSKERLSTETIIRYSVFFNLKDMKQIKKFPNTNLTRLLLIVCMEHEGIFQDVEEIDSEYIESLHDTLQMGPEEDAKVLKASEKVYQILKDRLGY